MTLQLDPVAYRRRIAELDCVVVDPQSKDFQPTSVVVMCHGFGAPGTDLVPCSEAIVNLQPESCQNIRFVFPAGPLEMEPGYDARAWWPIDMEKLQSMIDGGEFRELRNETPDLLSVRRQQLIDLVEQLVQEHSLDYSKIVLGGFSQGAMLTTDVALHLKKEIGGLVVWSGTLLNEKQWRANIKECPPIPVFQSHGHSDPILSLIHI